MHSYSNDSSARRRGKKRNGRLEFVNLKLKYNGDMDVVSTESGKSRDEKQKSKRKQKKNSLSNYTPKEKIGQTERRVLNFFPFISKI
jgi:hypothetical protein